MELAARNHSLGGRELLQEIIERGPAREEIERPQAQSPRAAFAATEIDHPDHRTPVEQANWLSEQSQMMRDLYERGADVKGDVLVVPAEEHELNEERDTPFITTLSYALRKIGDGERAREFHALGLAISGATADARTQITVFKTYYDRITPGARAEHFHNESGVERAETLAQTLDEMRLLAAEMARLEARVSIDAVQSAEDREDEFPQGRLSTAARWINLRDESLRLPAGLSYEQKERLISKTIPEIDYRLEHGVSRAAIFKAIDGTMFRPDASQYARKLAELTERSADENPERPVSKEEYLESQQTLLRLCEQERRRLRTLKATHEDNELEPHEDARLSQTGNLARRLGQELIRNAVDAPLNRAGHSRLFVSLSNKDAEADALRLPISSVKVYETMTKIAAGEKLSLQTWADKEGPEVRLALTEREVEERSRIGGFLKSYVDERLRDPETRALNTSAVFREARASIINAATPEVLCRVAADLLRVNERRSEELRRHHAAPEKYQPPSVRPLNTPERNLLFNGRAPGHHTPEMRELRLNFGLSRMERVARVTGLREGTIAPSEVLKTLLQELETRKTARAVAHFQASLINERMRSEDRPDLRLLEQRIPPHERTFLYELSEERKRTFEKLPPFGRSETVRQQSKSAEPSVDRVSGAIPKDSPTLREYLASMGRIERRLLNEVLGVRGIKLAESDSGRHASNLSITQARALLPESLQREVRLQARNLAWQGLIPKDVFTQRPSAEAMRIGDTIAYIQEELQEKASIAQVTRNDFVTEKGRLESLSSADRRKLADLDHYVAQTREEIYRSFERLDAQRQELYQTKEYKHANSQEFSDSYHMPISQPERGAGGRALNFQPALPLDRVLPINTRHDERGFGQAEIATRAALSTRIQSDREWHFDSLREVLSHRLNTLQDALPVRETSLEHQADHDLTSQR